MDDRSKGKREFDVDENGNPSSASETYPLLSHNYKQMREYSGSRHPSKKLDSAFPARLESFGSYPINGQSVKDLEDSHLNQEGGRKRKKVKKEKGVERKAEECENYQGNKALDELLSFIENNGTGAKNTKKLNHTDSQVEKNKKNKDKKHRVTQEKSEFKADVKIGERKDKASENLGTHSKHIILSVENTDSVAEAEVSVSREDNSILQNYTVEEEEKDVVKDNICISNSVVNETEKQEVEDVEKIMGNSTAKITNEESENLDMDVEGTFEDAVKKEYLDDVKTVEEIVENRMENNLCKKDVDIVKESAINHKIINTNSVSEESEKKMGKNGKGGNTVNGIKHNNVKNSKKKMAASDKGDSANQSVTNGPKNVVTSQIDFLKTEDLGDHSYSNYIFTDIDTIKPVEEEFKVVGGKKKKKGGSLVKEIPQREVFLPPRPVAREERRKPTRSITPPPSSYSIASDTEPDHNPDLSLSSFPALASARQGRSTFRDGRRNSTGDVPKEIPMKSTDDSDMESVKSLPVASQALSPRLPMSYAKMAASPKPNGTLADIVHDEGRIVDPAEKGADLKCAVWKGSLTERRHSIGSSREGKESDLPASRQKFGSQELVKSAEPQDVCASSESSEIVQENPLKDGSSDAPLSEQAYEEESMPSCSVRTDHQTLSSRQVEEACSDLDLKDNVGQENQVQDVYSSQFETKFKPSKSKSFDCPKSMKTVMHKTTNNKKVPKSHQSVVFLDKRVKIPQNLGITFGFLDSDSELQDVSSELVNTSSDTSVSNSVSNTEIDNTVLCQPSSPPLQESVRKANNSESISFTKGTSSDTVIHSSEVSVEKPCSNSSSNKLSSPSVKTNDYKKLQHLDGKNGIVNHLFSSNIQPNPNSDSILFMSEPCCEVSSVTDESKISEDSDPAKGNNSVDVQKLGNYVLVHFGDGITNSSETESDTKDTVGQIQYQPEKEKMVHRYNGQDVELANFLFNGKFSFSSVRNYL